MKNLSDEELKEIVKESFSFSEACRKASKYARGASLQNFTRRIKNLGVDLSHFLGKAACAGSRNTGKAKKKKWSELLHEKYSSRLRSKWIRRAFKEFCLENKIHIECTECKLSEVWNNKPIKLEVDHINNKNTDNKPTNLRWLCPNCHSQK